MGLHTPEERGRLLYILADGHLREQVDETTPGAKLRVVLADDGIEKARKWELIYPGITGKITSVGQYIGDYGTNINITITDGTEEFLLSLKADSKYGEDFLHKLPRIDLSQEVSIKGYNFKDTKDSTRMVSGLTIEQGGEKLKSFFTWKEGDEWKNVEGYPLPDKKTKERGGELWKMYFANTRVWIIDYLETNGYIQAPKTVESQTTEEKADGNF